MADQLTNNALGIIPGVMALGLAGNVLGNSLKQFPKGNLYGKPSIKMKTNFKSQTIKPLFRSAVGVMIGVPLISATSKIINNA